MKTNTVSQRLFAILLALALAVIVAGACVIGVLGFNPDATQKDAVSVQVSGYLSQGELRDPIETFVSDRLEADGYTVKEVRYSVSYSLTEDVLEFVLSGDPARDLTEYAAQLQTALDASGIAGIDAAVVTVSAHNSTYSAPSTPVWKTAVGMAVGAVILLIYVAIRFRLAMGAAAFLLTLHDVLLTCALIALLRIPAGAAMVGVAVFVLLLSAWLQTAFCGRIRMLRRDREREELPALLAEEETALAAAVSRKGILAAAIALCAACVVGGVIGALLGLQTAWIMTASLIGVLVCAYSAAILAPAMHAFFIGKFGKNKEKREHGSKKKGTDKAQAAQQAE